jgi:hypothetical protein
MNASRIVYVIEEQDQIEKYGFATELLLIMVKSEKNASLLSLIRTIKRCGLTFMLSPSRA